MNVIEDKLPYESEDEKEAEDDSADSDWDPYYSK